MRRKKCNEGSDAKHKINLYWPYLVNCASDEEIDVFCLSSMFYQLNLHCERAWKRLEESSGVFVLPGTCRIIGFCHLKILVTPNF